MIKLYIFWRLENDKTANQFIYIQKTIEGFLSQKYSPLINSITKSQKSKIEPHISCFKSNFNKFKPYFGDFPANFSRKFNFCAETTQK